MNRKKISIVCGIILALLVAVLSVIVLTHQGGSVPSEQSLSDGVLTVAVVPSSDRYCYVAGDSYAGTEVTLAQNIAATAQVDCAMVTYESKTQAMAALTSGEVDIVLARMDVTDQRVGGFATSTPYGSGSLYLITPQNTFISTLSLLAEQVVVVSEDVTMDMKVALPSYSVITPMTITGEDDYVSLLKEGTAAAVLCSEWEAISLALSGEAVQVQPMTNSPMESYVAVMQPTEVTLYHVANQVIHAYLDGTLDR